MHYECIFRMDNSLLMHRILYNNNAFPLDNLTPGASIFLSIDTIYSY